MNRLPVIAAVARSSPSDDCTDDDLITPQIVHEYANEDQQSVGRAYAEGRISLLTVANALKVSRSDALEFLENNGFHRTIKEIRLSDNEREETLAKLRADRLHRKGQPEVTDSLIARLVIATQRIESVDARPWIEE